MDKVRIGIIGLGFMGTTHFRIHRENPNAVITAIADFDEKKRKGNISSVIGNIGNADNSVPLDMTGVKAYDNGYDLIADPEVDMVDICCPTPDHAGYIVAAIKAGKHVFSEKPLCRTLEQEKQIAEAVSHATSFVNFGLCVRAWPEYRYTWEHFQAGDYGKMLSATFRRLSPSIAGKNWDDWFMDGKRSGGALLDLHQHDADEVRYFFGRPKAVTAMGANSISKGGIDHVICLYHYDNNTVVEAEGSWAASKTTPFEMTFQIICEKATIRLMAEGFKVYWNDGRIDEPKVEATTGWHKELQYFVQCILEKTTPNKYQDYPSISDSFKIVMAEQQSIDQGGKRIEIQY